jgi:hypothetical protein
MPEASPLLAWDTFYVIVGSASAGLTGLMFVVVTLIPSAHVTSSDETLSAFGTPTVMHFCAALLVSAILCAPWQIMWHAGLAVGIAGAIGIVYVLIVIGRARRQSQYKTVAEDWIWHVVLPLATYAVLMIAAITLHGRPEESLFAFGGATIALLFIGIHNAWDTVTYIALGKTEAPPPPAPKK